ncbi:MAG: ABC transporter ATP-binding protein [Bacteroidales bacterium]|nr:ABC transporter ATP-binding protein [Bacteroidales bacterium]
MRPFHECFRGLMRMLRPHGARVLLSVLIGLLGVASSLGFVWVSKKVVDVATGAARGDLMTFVYLMLGIMLVQLICRVGARYWEGLIVVKAQNALRESAFRKVLFSTWNGKDRLHSGDTVSRLEEDIRVVVDFICVTVPDLLITIIQLIGASAYIFVLSPNLAWILLLIMPVAVLCSRLFFKKLRALTGEIRAGDAKVQGHIQENTQRRVLVRMLGAAGKVMEKLGGYQEYVYDRTLVRLNYNAVSRGFMQLGFAAGYALVFLWGVFGLRDGSLGYGTMVAFLQLVGQVQRPVAGIALQIPAFIRALSSEDRLLDIIEAPQEEEGDDIVLQGAPGVRVEHLAFTYEGVNNPVVKDLDFDFAPGSMTAIIGSTGAGKSTLVRVIMALLPPDSGSVVLYDKAGTEVESGVRTRCNFMYVPQGNSLMSGTIRDNLLLAKPDASDDELREVLHLAAADFVYNLQDGLETVCAEIGEGLSEGQAQRIAIARALLRPGGILVLDEATSALDADTELELLERLGARYRGSKTILCITHRPAATSYADKVLKL